MVPELLCKLIGLGRTISDPAGITVQNEILGVFFQIGNRDSNRKPALPF